MSRLTRKGLRGDLFRYQLMANIVGTLIIPLFVFTGIKIWTGHCKLEVEVFGVGHGYLYIIYLVCAGVLALRAKLNPLWILLMFGAGLVPGLTFYTEWIVVTRKIHPLIERQEASAAEAVPDVSRQN
jgi:integral membrane protein